MKFQTAISRIADVNKRRPMEDCSAIEKILVNNHLFSNLIRMLVDVFEKVYERRKEVKDV